MPEQNSMMTASRFNFAGSVTRAEVKSLISNPTLQFVQTSAPAVISTWVLLNDELFTARPDVGLRVYGFYSQVCDLSFLSRMGNVRSFTADSIMQATGIEYLTHLPLLKSLGIGIYNLNSFDFLATLPAEQIEFLSLEKTESKRPNLSHIARFTGLKRLFIEGHKKEIELIGGLTQLEDLTLRSITLADLSFLRNLGRLWSLDIKLGGTGDLSSLAGTNQLKYLELWQIKGLSDLSVISSLTGLQFLFLQNLACALNLPDFSKLANLRRVVCEGMSPSLDLTNLATAHGLQEFFYSTVKGQTADNYEWITRLKNLKCASITLGSNTANDLVEKMFAANNVTPYRFTPFVYV